MCQLCLYSDTKGTHGTALYCTLLYCSTVHCNALHYNLLHSTYLQGNALYCIALNCTLCTAHCALPSRGVNYWRQWCETDPREIGQHKAGISSGWTLFTYSSSHYGKVQPGKKTPVLLDNTNIQTIFIYQAPVTFIVVFVMVLCGIFIIYMYLTFPHSNTTN